MSKKTTNYNLIKPEPNDNYNIEEHNGNMDIIDGEIKAINNFKEKVIKFPKATGTGTSIQVNTGYFDLVSGNTVTFVAMENNNGQSTLLNIDNKGAKPIYKPGTVVAPTIKTGKAITVWYDQEEACFFIKASAEGTVTAENVLAGETFSNEDDTGLVGTMNNVGNVGALNLKNQGQEYAIPKGFHNGQGKIKADITGLVNTVIKSGSTVGGIQGTYTADANAQSGHMLNGVTAYVKGAKVTGAIKSKTAENFIPSTLDQTISSGQYLSGNQTILGDENLVSDNIKSGSEIFGVEGNSNVVDTASGDAVSAQILSGKKAYVKGEQVIGSIPSIGAQTIIPSKTNQTISSNQYINGTQTILGDVDLVSSNIKSGVSIFGVEGSEAVVDTTLGDATAGQILSGKKAYVGGGLVTGTISSKAAATFTPGKTNQQIASGQYLSGAQTILGDADLVSGNIKSGVSIFGVEGSEAIVDTSLGDATAAQILSGKKAYVDGALVTGSIPIAPTYPVENQAGQLHCYNAPPNPNEGNHNVFIQVPKGYYDNNWLGTRIDNLNAGNLKSGVVIGDDAFITGTFTSDATAAADHILTGQSAYVNGNKVIGTMSDYANKSVYLGTNCYSAIGLLDEYHLAINLKPETNGYNGHFGTGTVVQAHVYNTIPSNIRAGVAFGGVGNLLTGTFTSDATALASDIREGKSGYVNGAKVTGTMPDRSAISIGAAVLTDHNVWDSVCTWAGQNEYVGALDIKMPAGYYNGTSSNRIHIPNLLAENIKSGVKVGWDTNHIVGTLSNHVTASDNLLAYSGALSKTITNINTKMCEYRMGELSGSVKITCLGPVSYDTFYYSMTINGIVVASKNYSNCSGGGGLNYELNINSGDVIGFYLYCDRANYTGASVAMRIWGDYAPLGSFIAL